MVSQVKLNSSKKKRSNKLISETKKKNIRNKNKQNEFKASKKTETTPSQNAAVDKSIYPSAKTTVKVFIGVRLVAAMWNHISDCDETFNYWEPSHYLLYGKGFQTWEYSPLYALRSYTYILLHIIPAWFYANFSQPNRMFVFYFMRCLLGLFCTFCELYFYKAVYNKFNSQVGQMVFIFSVFSPGMYIASVAFLPSSFSMYMCLLSTGAWINKKYELAIFTVALSTFISWPFAALIGAPIALDMLVIKKQFKKFINWSVISSITILLPLIQIDSELYGRFVIAPLNIIIYNVFTNHGPNLYGTEPIFFYLVNGFLNFNVAFIAAILAPSFLLLRNYLVTKAKKEEEFFASWLLLTPFYWWFIVFTIQPHKEERFLFPVYPLICLCAAFCINSIQIIYSVTIEQIFGKASHWMANSSAISIATCGIFILLSFSRIIALQGYNAPMVVYMKLNKIQAEGKVSLNLPVNVCVGKEWHRFPTSFFLPNNNWNLKFLKSEFKGQLPAEYSPLEKATSVVHSHFNDLNREEQSRYFDINKCHFLVDCDYGKTTSLEPNYTSQTDKWSVILSVPYLNSEKSKPFFRSFYIPFISEEFRKWASYNLLQSTKLLNNLN